MANDEPWDDLHDDAEEAEESFTLDELCEPYAWCSLPAALSPVQEFFRAWEGIGHYEQPEGEELLDLILALEGIQRAGIRVSLAATTQLVLASPHAFIRHELLRALMPRHAARQEHPAW